MAFVRMAGMLAALLLATGVACAQGSKLNDARFARPYKRYAQFATQRRTASSGSIGAPNSRHSGIDRLAPIELEFVSPLRWAQSRHTPKC
jgi:hypothetical protein